MFLFWNWSSLFKLDFFHVTTTEIVTLYIILEELCVILWECKKTYKMWQKTYVHMLSTTHILNLSNKPLITQHIDRKMTSDVTVHTLKMGTLCQYYLIITILLKFFSPNEFCTVKIIQLPVTCYNNHTSNPKTDELAAFLLHVPPQ